MRTESVMTRVHNFGAGPAALPLSVLEQAQHELTDYAGQGMSLMEMSHRSKLFIDVIEAAEANVRALLAVPEEYAVLFLQGGASTQFAMLAQNLLGAGQTADYVHSGAWAKKAIAEAKVIGEVNLAWNGEADKFMRMPTQEDLQFTDNAAYVHVTSNETIGGVQMQTFPQTAAPLIADMSSDIMSRPLEVKQFGMIYAGAQKNIGPSGLALVILRKDLAERCPDTVSRMFRYSTHLEAKSLYNTPNTWAIYLVKLVTDWLLEQGGLTGVAKKNANKAAILYDVLDASDFWQPAAQKEYRSLMNVTWRLANTDLEPAFITKATEAGLVGLKGHRSVGGIRASIYNACPLKSVQTLVEFMIDFAKRNG